MGMLARHCIFQTDELEEGARFAGQIWEHNSSRVTDGRYGLRWHQAELNKSSLSFIEHDCAVDLAAQGPLSDHFRIFFHTSGSIDHTLNGQQAFSDRDHVIAHAPDVDLKLNIRPFELLLVSLRGEFVRQALGQRFEKLPNLETWVGSLPTSPCVEALRSMATWLCSELERPESPLAVQGKPRLHAEKMLLATFVECLMQMTPHDVAVPTEIGEHQVRRAEEWIAAHATEALGIEEVAEAVGVGVRSLQRTFQRIRGYSPSQAVLQQRLNHARRALLLAAPQDTVTSIAAESGFFELGRFARQYRAHFGETPSQTLARERRAQKT